VLSSFRAQAQEEVEQRRNVATATATPQEEHVDHRVLPLSGSQKRIIQDTLIPLLASAEDSGDSCSPYSMICSIHSKAFPMFAECSYSGDPSTNDQIHMAVVLFNLALSFHMAARPNASSVYPPVGLSQARALYGHALKLLQGFLEAPTSNHKHLVSPSSAAAFQRCGNDFVDFLIMAILNNMAVLCCGDSVTKDDQSALSVRNASYVRHFALFVEGAREQRRGGSFWLGNAALAKFERNVMSLGLLFVRGSAAAAA
jgi:hypothetical protein